MVNITKTFNNAKVALKQVENGITEFFSDIGKLSKPLASKLAELNHALSNSQGMLQKNNKEITNFAETLPPAVKNSLDQSVYKPAAAGQPSQTPTANTPGSSIG